MRKINKLDLDKRKKIIILIFILIFILIMIFLLYISNKNIREWIDMHLLGKNITEGDTQVINLNTDKNNQVHVYSKYIAILNDKIVTLYNSYGEKVTTVQVNINSAIFDSSDKYFVIAEKQGHELCLLLEKTYLWSENIEGEILQVNVNQNGFVAVVSTDVSHKSILTLYNSEGKKLFTTYLSSTRIIDVSISSDNKYIALGELDTSGTVVQSNIKVISVQNAKDNPEKTIIYTYNATVGDLITNVQYQDKGQITCLYDSGISVIKDNNNYQILKLDNDNITFMTNSLKKHVAYIQEENEGLFKLSSNIHIIRTNDNHESIYKLEDVAKNIYAKDDMITVNAGTNLYFINTNGWLIKKYTAKQEITNIQFSDGLCAVIYKDKIVIVNL